MTTPITIIINASSGAEDKENICQHLAEIFKASGLDAQLSLARCGADLMALARQVALDESRIVVAGGGDGTINAVAAGARRHGEDARQAGGGA